MNLNSLRQHFNDFSTVYLAQALFNGCFYGIRAIFVLYAISRLALKESQAISLFATFMILCYGTSLIGGYLADKGLGVKNTILAGGALCALGLFCILLPSPDFCFLGLALTSLGSGFFKPNMLASVGLLFENPQDPRKDKAYSFLYIAMNFGSFIAPILCGFVGKTWGWHYGILLVSGVFIGATWFVYKKMHFHPSYKEDLTLSKRKAFLGTLSLVLLLYLLFKHQNSVHGLMGMITCGSLAYLGNILYQCSGEERRNILTIMAYILLFSVFSALFEQEATSLMLFYNEAVDRQIMGMVVPAATFLSLSPLFVLTCSPFLIMVSDKYLEKKKPINGFIKIGCGFLCAALSFGILALASHYHHNSSLISPLWVVGVVFIQVIGELWVAPISYSKISQYAPPHFKSVLMGFWYMALAYGHYFAGFLAQFSLSNRTDPSLNPSFEGYQTFFVSLALLALCVSLSLLLSRSIYVIIFNNKDFFP